MQADFGVVSNVGATHDVAAHSKQVKPKNVKRKSIDLHGANTSKFHPKLLEILNNNQDELLEEQSELTNQATIQPHQIQQQRQQPIEHNMPQQIKIQQYQQMSTQSKQLQQPQQITQSQQAQQITQHHQAQAPQTPQTPQSPVLKPPTPVQNPIEPVFHHHQNTSHNLVR